MPPRYATNARIHDLSQGWPEAPAQIVGQTRVRHNVCAPTPLQSCHLHITEQDPSAKRQADARRSTRGFGGIHRRVALRHFRHHRARGGNGRQRPACPGSRRGVSGPPARFVPSLSLGLVES